MSAWRSQRDDMQVDRVDCLFSSEMPWSSCRCLGLPARVAQSDAAIYNLHVVSLVALGTKEMVNPCLSTYTSSL